MSLDKLSRNDWIVGGLALLLAIDLLLLPWFSIFSFDFSATDAPDGWTGILALLVLIALIADLLVERLAPETTVPNFGGSRTATRFRLAVIAVAFLALKFVLHIHFGYFGFGFYVAVVLSVALIFATLRLSQGREIHASVAS